MRDAPPHAVFVWVNANVRYAERLARGVGRPDLKIVEPQWLERAWGLCAHVVVDHAAVLTEEQAKMLRRVRCR